MQTLHSRNRPDTAFRIIRIPTGCFSRTIELVITSQKWHSSPPHLSHNRREYPSIEPVGRVSIQNFLTTKHNSTHKYPNAISGLYPRLIRGGLRWLIGGSITNSSGRDPGQDYHEDDSNHALASGGQLVQWGEESQTFDPGPIS